EEQPGSFERARHVGAFGNDLDPVVDEIGRVFGVDFVLGGAGERAVSFDVPQRVVAELHVSGHEDGFLVLVRILANAAALYVLQFHDPGQLLTIDAVGIIDHAVGIGDRDRLRAEVKQLLDGVLRDIAAARYQAGLAIERFFAGLQHFLREVHAAIASGFRTDQRTAPVQPLAGEHAGEFIPDALVLAEQETDLATTHADIAGRNVGVRANVAAQFGHEALAEAHDFVVALALGIEIRSAFAAAHGQRGQRVLEDLLEGKELQDAEIDGGMEAQAAFVGADRAVHLNTETAIDLDIALVIKPRYAEHQDALGFHDALEDPRGNIFRMSLQHQTQRLEYFLDCLMKFWLGWVLRLHQCHNIVNVIARSLDRGRGCSYSTHRGPPRTLQLLFWAVSTMDCPPLKRRWANRPLNPILFESYSGRVAVTAITQPRDETAYNKPFSKAGGKIFVALTEQVTSKGRRKVRWRRLVRTWFRRRNSNAYSPK